MPGTVAVFPNPYLTDKWSSVMHPLLSTWAISLKEAGWNVIGLNAEDLYNTELIKNICPDVIIIHWTETLTTYFINQIPSGKILTSAISKVIPYLLRKKLANSVTPLVKTMIDEWSQKISKLNIKLISQVHELISHSFTEPGLAECDNYMKSKVFEISSAFQTQEESSVPLIKKFYNSEKKYGITYLGDYTKFHGEIISKSEARIKLSLKENSRIISYIGTARKNRNPTEVIKSYLKAATGNSLLIVAGMGVGKYIPVKSDKIIIYDELIPNEKLRNIFSSSDFVINDAYEYMTSAVVRTAISYHVPVIVRNYGASIDMASDASILIEDGLNGLDNAITKSLSLSAEEYNFLVNGAVLRNVERQWNQYGKAFDDLITSLDKE
ncbi:MAG: glycosyltransferase [Ignavibacteriae bacterium]|nr:glycosyltransferase [Ignavibacteriota bacterium]